MKIKLLLNTNVFLTCFLIIGIFNFSQNLLNAQSTIYTEDFETFTIGNSIGTDADWYDGGSGPVIGAANGVAGSQGLGAASNIFTWSAHTFDWNASDLVSVSMQMDFKTDGSAHFDDDRIGWMIGNPTTSSSNIMSVQLDPGGSGYNIEGYWDGVSSADRRPSIVNLTSLNGDTWYRFWVKFTKLTSTSCSIDVSLTELDGSGNPTGTPIKGTIANTAVLGADEPNSKYFTSGLSPAFKNYTVAAAPADNAHFEIVTTVSAPTISITGTPLSTFFSTAGIASAEQSYTVSGSSLTDDITITAPADFEVSLTSGGGFGSSALLTQSGGSVAPTSIYVRLNRATDGSSSGDISHTSTGAATENVPVSGTASVESAVEDFELFTIGNVVGSHADWFDNGSGPVVQAANGVGGSQGLAPGSSIFIWSANPFDWTAADFSGITVQMDFQANASGEFDDDRVGWMIDNTSTNSNYIFGVQLDNAGGHLRMETYWDNSFGDDAGRIELADLDLVTIDANGWYRLIVDFAKLDAASASIYSELWSLDGSGNTVSMIANGSVPNTALVGTGITPNAGYFTGPIWPAFKNHSSIVGAADNAYFDIGDPLPVELSTFTVSIVKDKVELSWKTETELNNYGFEIERKTKDYDWQKMGFVEGHGNSNSPKTYTYLDNSSLKGKYTYRLKQIDNDGKFEYSKSIEIELTPNEFSLFQNYPNPFNPSTTIKYALPQNGKVRLVLFNMLGEELSILVDEIKEAGIHEFNFNAKDLGSGIYFYKIETSNFVSVKKMILVK